MTIHWPAKSPTEKNTSYELDWTGRIDVGDTITGSVWSLVGTPPPTSITFADGGHQGVLTKITISDGTPNQTYIFLNSLTMQSGATLTRKASLLIKDQ